MHVAAGEPADIVIVDLEPFDLEMASRVKRAYPAAEILAICGTYREADCIAISGEGTSTISRGLSLRRI